MTTPQSHFTIVLPATDQSTPPNPIVVGQLTGLGIEITVAGVKTTYSATLDPATAVGATVQVPFTGLLPAFAPVAGTQYTADAYAVDAAGNGMDSTAVAWTQLAAATPPAKPTSFGVA